MTEVEMEVARLEAKQIILMNNIKHLEKELSDCKKGNVRLFHTNEGLNKYIDEMEKDIKERYEEDLKMAMTIFP